MPIMESPIATTASASATVTFRVSARTSSRCAFSDSSCSSNAPRDVAGSSAPYPVSLIASTSCSADTAFGSNETVALLSIRFTVASATPAVRASVRWTRAWHAAQVIPVTGMTSRASESVLGPECWADVFPVGAVAVAMMNYTPMGYTRRSMT